MVAPSERRVDPHNVATRLGAGQRPGIRCRAVEPHDRLHLAVEESLQIALLPHPRQCRGALHELLPVAGHPARNAEIACHLFAVGKEVGFVRLDGESDVIPCVRLDPYASVEEAGLPALVWTWTFRLPFPRVLAVR